MSDWVRVCAAAELLPGDYRVVVVGALEIAVFNIDGLYFAVEDVCTHDGAELTGGVVDGFEVECPRHGARFDVRTGAALRAPAYTPIATFPVKLEDGEIFTRDPR